MAANVPSSEPEFSENARIFTVPASGGRPLALTGEERDGHAHDHEADEQTSATGERGEDAEMPSDEGSDDPEGAAHAHEEERQVDNPIWSPAGDQIAFTQTPCEYCPPELFVMGADGADPRRLNRVRNAFQPTWSPDGRRLAVLLPGPRGGVYTFDRNGRQKRRVLTDSAAIEAPSWSPTGDRIAYARQVAATNWDIYVVSQLSGRRERLTRSPAQETTPEFSPDGTRIALARQLAHGNWAIHTMRADGAHLRRVTDGRVSAVEPSWSPDGRRIAFTAQDARSRSVIAVVDVRSGRRRSITGPALYATQPAWSPDGKTIAFAARERE